MKSSVKQIASVKQFEVESTCDGLAVVVDITTGRTWTEPTDIRSATEAAETFNYAGVSRQALRRAAGAFNNDREASSYGDPVPIYV